MERRPVPLRIHPFAQSLVLVVMDVFTRRIVGFGVERASIDGLAVCRMFNHAIAGKPLPRTEEGTVKLTAKLPNPPGRVGK